jgi:hypothetical protein
VDGERKKVYAFDGILEAKKRNKCSYRASFVRPGQAWDAGLRVVA